METRKKRRKPSTPKTKPTKKQKEAWHRAVERLEKLKFTSTSTAPMPNSLDMIREDRDR